MQQNLMKLAIKYWLRRIVMITRVVGGGLGGSGCC